MVKLLVLEWFLMMADGPLMDRQRGALRGMVVFIELCCVVYYRPYSMMDKHEENYNLINFLLLIVLLLA